MLDESEIVNDSWLSYYDMTCSCVFEVSKVILVQTAMFWVMMPCNFAGDY